MKMMEPIGVAPVALTVAVRVTVWPWPAGFGDAVRPVVVAAGSRRSRSKYTARVRVVFGLLICTRLCHTAPMDRSLVQPDLDA